MNIFDSLLEFLELGAVARAMRDSLAYRLVAPEVHLPEQEQAAINHALSHLGKVREGFVISQRASDTPRMSELRDLVKAILLEWRRAEELFGVQLMPSNEVELPRTQLLAFAHSYVTFAMIPQLPPDQVTFPQARRTWRVGSFAALWISMSACIPTYMLASSLIEGGMNWSEAILTIFLGNLMLYAVDLFVAARIDNRIYIHVPGDVRGEFSAIPGDDVNHASRQIARGDDFREPCSVEHYPVPGT